MGHDAATAPVDRPSTVVGGRDVEHPARDRSPPAHGGWPADADGGDDPVDGRAVALWLPTPSIHRDNPSCRRGGAQRRGDAARRRAAVVMARLRAPARIGAMHA
jgi:hypothetical protein